MPKELGDGPIQDEYRETMVELAHMLDRMFNGELRGPDRTTGFVLMVYGFGDSDIGSRCNYISNGADRKDVVCLMKEMIARFEGQPAVTGRA